MDPHEVLEPISLTLSISAGILLADSIRTKLYRLTCARAAKRAERQIRSRKAKILKVGDPTEDPEAPFTLEGWEFAPHDEGPVPTVCAAADGSTLVFGYTIDELKTIQRNRKEWVG